MKSAAKRLVIIPTFNEASNISVLVPRLFKHISELSILVVDDGSPDGTSELCVNLKQKYPNLHLLNRGRKSGFASAYIQGFRIGLANGYTEIIQMDADMSHRVRDLAKMIDAKNAFANPDVIIGSRWIKGGSTENWPFQRQLLSRTANLYAEIMLGLHVADCTGGFRIYSAEILRKINLNQIKSEGYSFQIEMTRAAKRAGATIIEVPITFRERESGVSKMSKAIVREAMTRVTVWGIQRFLHLK